MAMNQDERNRTYLVISIIVISLCVSFLFANAQSKPRPECIKTEARVYNVLIGKALMPQVRQECIEYKR